MIGKSIKQQTEECVWAPLYDFSQGGLSSHDVPVTAQPEVYIDLFCMRAMVKEIENNEERHGYGFIEKKY